MAVIHLLSLIAACSNLYNMDCRSRVKGLIDVIAPTIDGRLRPRIGRGLERDPHTPINAHQRNA